MNESCLAMFWVHFSHRAPILRTHCRPLVVFCRSVTSTTTFIFSGTVSGANQCIDMGQCTIHNIDTLTTGADLFQQSSKRCWSAIGQLNEPLE